MTILAAAGLALSITGLVIVLRRNVDVLSSQVLEPDALSLGLIVPGFTLVDQDGAPVTQGSLEGRVTILDFIFTNCPFVCPGMTMAMSELAAALRETPARFMSISVDPVHDTPERLREFGGAHGADLSRWTLLTGDYATIERIVKGSLQFELQPDPSRTVGLPDGSKMANIIHPGKLMLVGPDLRVIGLYDPNRPEEMRTLLNRAKMAAMSLPKSP